MKKIIYPLICATLLSIASCDSFLDEAPKSDLTLKQFYQTEAQATANVNRLYWQGVVKCYADGSGAYLGPKATIPGMLTGYFINSYEGQEIVCKYARELTRQENPSTLAGTVKDMWDPCYEAINVANGAITYIPGIDMGDAVRTKLMGEARFFRAFNYFYLVKTFGAVPMTTEPYESLEDEDRFYQKRASVDSLYQLIESDLKEAVEALPAVKFAENGHHATKFSAAMLLANVYLQQGKYADAAKYAKIVIDSSHSLTQNDDLAMNSAYNKLRAIDDLDESIYAVEFNESIRSSSWWPTYSFDAKGASVFNKYAIFTRVYGPTKRFLNIYKEDDLRIQPNQFFHWAYKNPLTGKEWISESDEANCWYYYDENALLNTGKGTKDVNLFRYAEALLVGAESIAQSTGVTAEAAQYLGEIKARADMNGKTADQYATELQGLSKDAFIQECWTERLREFPLEFKIWDDCIRTGKFPNISETEKGKITYVTLVGATNGSDKIFQESDLLWPISIDEIQRNPELTQNPGYE